MKLKVALLILLGSAVSPDLRGTPPPQLLEQQELKYYNKVRSLLELTPGELRKYCPELKRLDPAPDQEGLPTILQKVGENVETFIREFPNTVSTEDIRQERLNQSGVDLESEHQTFSYLVLSREQGILPGLNEFRTDAKGRRVDFHALQGPSMLTSGFASVSIHFHPKLQQDSSFRYLGRQAVGGHDTEVVAFAQRPDAAQSGARIEVQDRSGTLLVQGIAWIDSASHQILRLRLDLLAPRPDLMVERQTTEVQFAEVRFSKVPKGVWLPRDVVVTLAVGGELFRNSHHYSHFKLFNVEAKQKVNE